MSGSGEQADANASGDFRREADLSPMWAPYRAYYYAHS